MAKPLQDFELEIYFAKYEFEAKYLLCCSDAETLTMKELLSMAAEDSPDALDRWNNLSLGYTESKGLPLLREEIARQFYSDDSFDIKLGASDVICFAGAEEGIYATMRAILQPADHVIVVTPCYQSLISVAESICEVSTICLEENNNWNLNTNKLRKLIRPNETKLIVINFPHNPTGALISQACQAEIIAIAEEFQLYIFADEVYRGLETHIHEQLRPFACMYAKAFSLSVMSKTLGLAGLVNLCMHV